MSAVSKVVEVRTAHLSVYFQKHLVSLNVLSKITVSSSQLEKLTPTRICQIVTQIVNKRKLLAYNVSLNVFRGSFYLVINQYLKKRKVVLQGGMEILHKI